MSTAGGVPAAAATKGSAATAETGDSGAAGRGSVALVAECELCTLMSDDAGACCICVWGVDEGAARLLDFLPSSQIHPVAVSTSLEVVLGEVNQRAQRGLAHQRVQRGAMATARGAHRLRLTIGDSLGGQVRPFLQLLLPVAHVI